jgi:hypothetical protein
MQGHIPSGSADRFEVQAERPRTIERAIANGRRPSTAGSPPNQRCQKPWLRTTTSTARSSFLRRERPPQDGTHPEHPEQSGGPASARPAGASGRSRPGDGLDQRGLRTSPLGPAIREFSGCTLTVPRCRKAPAQDDQALDPIRQRPRRTALTKVKIVVLALILGARERIATAVNPGSSRPRRRIGRPDERRRRKPGPERHGTPPCAGRSRPSREGRVASPGATRL